METKHKKAMSTQVIFFIAMSLIMVWIIIFGLQKINDVKVTISTQEEIEIKNELEEAFTFCSDPINTGSFKIIDLSGRPYNSICFNCQLASPTIIPQELINEAKILSEGNVNFILLDTTYTSSGIEEYNILGELSIEELGYDEMIAWVDETNSREKEIEIRCE